MQLEKITFLQENYNTPLQHTPIGNPPIAKYERNSIGVPVGTGWAPDPVISRDITPINGRK